MLTVEVLFDSKAAAERLAEVAICCDDAGLDYLIRKLHSLRGKSDHLHLMTPAWAGEGLDERKQGGDDYVLVNHLRIVHRL
ncbi:MAG TPA: Imm32 family immunity protein [Candidatus Methylomirabilis sp.]|nr:Imm32 family immunity protein [Candidatus Methylomirabilis sp.]